jgi:hypothetical protein
MVFLIFISRSVSLTLLIKFATELVPKAVFNISEVFVLLTWLSFILSRVETIRASCIFVLSPKFGFTKSADVRNAVALLFIGVRGSVGLVVISRAKFVRKVEIWASMIGG